MSRRRIQAWAESPSGLRTLIAVGFLGVVARCWLVWISEGSNDIRYWLHFSQLVNFYGFGRAYTLDGWLNHPPLTVLWAAWCGRVAGTSLLEFAHLFKLPSLLAEISTAVLLYWVYRLRGSKALGCAAFALYAIAPGNTLISSFHGNTDAIYVGFAFAAAFVMQETKKAWLGGLLLGLALNVKLIPIVLVLPLAAKCADRRQLTEYLLGLASAGLPYAIALGGFTEVEREAFIGNVFGYKSFPDVWGIELVSRTLLLATKTLPGVSAVIRDVRDFYYLQASKVLIGLSAVLALYIFYRRRHPIDAYAASAAAFSIFLLLAPGFAVQYPICLLPGFIGFRLRSGIAVGIVTGLQAALTYGQFVTSWSPLATNHTGTPDVAAGLATVTWTVIAVHAWRTLGLTWPAPKRKVSLETALWSRDLQESPGE